MITSAVFNQRLTLLDQKPDIDVSIWDGFDSPLVASLQNHQTFDYCTSVATAQSREFRLDRRRMMQLSVQDMHQMSLLKLLVSLYVGLE